MQEKISLGDIFRQFGQAYIHKHGIKGQEKGLINLLGACRTQELGKHFEKCNHCGYLGKSFNSCRNRHCPSCQQKDKLQWLDKRMSELLPLGYYHLVFTIPQQLNPLCLKNKKLLYAILFKAASQTVLELAKDPKHLGAETGLLAVLHTWGQNMMEHPHLHCIMPAGGLSANKQHWVHVNKKGDFFVHYKAISRKFRGKFLDLLNQAYQKGELYFRGDTAALSGKKAFTAFLTNMYTKEWVVNIQKPIGKPEKVLEYLSRYVFRVAITERRIMEVKDGKVKFTWKDYRQGNFCFKKMKLDIDEFIRRFLLHALPKGFFKVRYFGIFSSRFRAENIVRAKNLLDRENKDKQEETLEDGGTVLKKQDTVWDQIMQMIKNYKKPNCPICKKGRMCFAGIDYPKNGWEEG
jgi:hypothetical protein